MLFLMLLLFVSSVATHLIYIYDHFLSYLTGLVELLMWLVVVLFDKPQSIRFKVLAW